MNIGTGMGGGIGGKSFITFNGVVRGSGEGLRSIGASEGLGIGNGLVEGNELPERYGLVEGSGLLERYGLVEGGGLFDPTKYLSLSSYEGGGPKGPFFSITQGDSIGVS